MLTKHAFPVEVAVTVREVDVEATVVLVVVVLGSDVVVVPEVVEVVVVVVVAVVVLDAVEVDAVVVVVVVVFVVLEEVIVVELVALTGAGATPKAVPKYASADESVTPTLSPVAGVESCSYSA